MGVIAALTSELYLNGNPRNLLISLIRDSDL